MMCRKRLDSIKNVEYLSSDDFNSFVVYEEYFFT